MNAEKLKQDGIEKALNNANNTHEKWEDIAYNFLLEYAKNNRTFQIEEVRESAVGIVPPAPSKRSWGGITQTAQRNRIIRSIGYKPTKGTTAHKALANVWSSNIYVDKNKPIDQLSIF